jgi:DNA-binding transcriptional ArsR family regulator
VGLTADANRQVSAPHPARAREPLPAQLIELAAKRLQLVAGAKRIALLEALSEGEAGVQELADRIGSTHQNASHHLALLRRAGILSARSEGTTTFYAIEDWSAWWVVEQIVGLLRPCQEEPALTVPHE